MGIVAPIGKDPLPPPEFVPSPVRSGSARITFQLHAHTYTSSVKLHYNTTKTQTTTTTIQFTTFGMFRGGEEHPQISTLVLRFPRSPTARTSRTRSRRSHFLFFITGTCCLFMCHHWKTQVRYPLIHHWKTLLSPHLRNRGR